MSEDLYTHVIAAEPLSGGWFNPDETRFALVPDENGRVDEETARILEQMLSEHDGVESGGHSEELFAELVDLHARRIVLWPLGLLWGRSHLGAIDEQWFKFFLAESDPEFTSARDEIRAGSAVAHLKPPQQRTYSFALWKFLAAFHYSSSSVATLDDLQEAHFLALGRIVRPDGVWVDWASGWFRTTLKFLIRHIATLRADPHFGRSLDRTVFMARGKRNVDLFSDAPHLEWLPRRFDAWINERVLMVRKAQEAAKRLLAEALLLLEADQVNSPERAFSRTNMLHLLKYAESWSTPLLRSNAIGRIHQFGKWMEDESRDALGKPRIVFHLSQIDIDRFRDKALRHAKKSSGSEVVARPMPYRLHQQLKKIISADNFAWPKSLTSGIDGRPLHWITREDPDAGTVHAVFNEVLPRQLMLLLDIPLRGIQARRLDSGEGDARRWDCATRKWGPSHSKHAGYWLAVEAKNPERGVFREILTHGSRGTTTITGLFINSNKTQDRANLFDETSGYVIPWQLDEALENLSAMRDWQEKYNPVSGPLPYSAIPDFIFNENPSDLARALIPDRFYLFRDPQNPGERGNEAPCSYKGFLQFFYDSLEELERQLNEDDPSNPIIIITERDKAGSPKKAIFTLHGTRASTIASLHAEGVPIAVLSKLVAGHATILMTLKYAKFEPAHISEILNRARVSAIHNAASEFRIFLANATYEQAARMSAWLKDDALVQLKGTYGEASAAWLGMDIGICPNGGTLCHIGGDELIKKRDVQGERNQYRETPGHERNCVRCRFLITGLPFLIPLCGRANQISARADQVQQRIVDNEGEIERLKTKRRDLNAREEPTPPELRQRIQILEAEWESSIQLRHQAFADFHAVLALIEKVRLIGKNSSDDQTLPMLLTEDGLPEVEGRESTRFELCDSVVQMGRFFPSLSSSDLERERDGFLDRILYSGGYIPISLAPLDPEEKRIAADAMAALLLGQLGAMETQNLIDGRKTLVDLGLQDRLDTVIVSSIGRPLERTQLATHRAAATATVELKQSDNVRAMPGHEGAGRNTPS